MEALIVLLPLFGALLAMPVGHWLGARASELLTIVLVGCAALYAWIIFFDVALGHNVRETIILFPWLNVGDFVANWAVRLDTMSVVMLVVVTTVSTIVHVYSVGYMHDDASRPRFFCYLSLFTFAMLSLVSADNFVQLFFGWEGVGLASYLLIGFYHHKASANDAAIKAFIVNRVGDFGFALGIMAVFFVFRSVEFDIIFDAIANNALIIPYGFAEAVPIQTLKLSAFGGEFHALTLIGILLFIGAMGKSAQFLLHTWLPDAMEGPTPVSALIHAATMVTAGVFLVCRCSYIYEYAPTAATMITVIGATTAFFAATIALLQDDIKKVIAYSTCSQLGYMFFAAGVGAYGAAMFHLFTHAFFKALLFLGAGCVIHALHHEQDMKKMGGARVLLPGTYLWMIVGTLAITGVGIPLLKIGGVPFGTAGFVSKDMIIESAFAGGEAGKGFAYYAFVMGLLAAVMTAFYSWRLIYLTFHGKTRLPKDVIQHPHNVPTWMHAPLWPLAIGGILAGMLFFNDFIGKQSKAFWGDSLYTFESHGSDHGATEHADAGRQTTEGAIQPYGPKKGSGLHDDLGHSNSIGSSSVETTANTTPAEEVPDIIAQTLKAETQEHAHTEQTTDAHADNAGGGGHHFPVWVLLAPFLAMLIGFGAASAHYMRGGDILRPGLIRDGGMIYALLKNKWYFDEVYKTLFVEPMRWLGRLLWRDGDGRIIDGFGPNGVSGLINLGSRLVVKIQSGYMYHYAFAMLLGVIVFLSLVLSGGF